MFREYRSGDWKAMFALDEQCFESPFRFSARAMRRFAEADDAVIVLAEHDAELAGFVIAHPERVNGERIAYIVTLDVHEQWRRQGLGQELMRRALALASRRGCSAAVLHVYIGNAAAIHFYQRLGFELSGTAAGFYGAGPEPLDALLLRLRIEAAA